MDIITHTLTGGKRIVHVPVTANVGQLRAAIATAYGGGLIANNVGLFCPGKPAATSRILTDDSCPISLLFLRQWPWPFSRDMLTSLPPPPLLHPAAAAAAEHHLQIHVASPLLPAFW